MYLRVGDLSVICCLELEHILYCVVCQELLVCDLKLGMEMLWPLGLDLRRVMEIP